jgi:hypothetical protein
VRTLSRDIIGEKESVVKGNLAFGVQQIEGEIKAQNVKAGTAAGPGAKHH